MSEIPIGSVSDEATGPPAASAVEIPAEIVFVGLCSFLNVNRQNPKMGEPSVVLVGTKNHNGHDHTHGGDEPKEHIPFIGFDVRKTRVDDEDGFSKKGAENMFRVHRVAGMEIIIESDPVEDADGNPIGAPTILDSYGDVAKRDEYWPAMKNEFDPDLVPEKGKKPNPKKAAAFLRFGSGTIAGDHLSPEEWVFKDGDGETSPPKKYAREVRYSRFPHSGDKLVLRLKPLPGHPGAAKTLTFRAAEGSETIEVWIGNNVESDIAPTLFRMDLRPRETGGEHFVFLNATAGNGLTGPVPVPILPDEEPVGTGDTDGGYCGPHNGSGGPP